MDSQMFALHCGLVFVLFFDKITGNKMALFSLISIRSKNIFYTYIFRISMILANRRNKCDMKIAVLLNDGSKIGYFIAVFTQFLAHYALLVYYPSLSFSLLGMASTLLAWFPCLQHCVHAFDTVSMPPVWSHGFQHGHHSLDLRHGFQVSSVVTRPPA